MNTIMKSSWSPHDSHTPLGRPARLKIAAVTESIRSNTPECDSRTTERNVVMDTTFARPTLVSVDTVEEDLRFAELTARSGLEPELAQRYETSPALVLAEFGLSVPAAAPAGATVVIEDLSRSAAGAMAIPT